MASSRAISAHLGNGDYGSAVQERDRITVESAQLKLKTEDLTLRSPIYGVVLTPRLRDRLGSYLTAGAEFVEVADLQSLRARIYVSEFDMYKVQEGAPAKVHVDGAFKKWDSRAASVTPVALASDPALLDQTKFKGLRPPQFYVVEIPVPDENGFLRPGMTGTARVYGRRRSLMGFVFEAAQAALGRKIW
jgi:multidrug resistance efflux pump